MLCVSPWIRKDLRPLFYIIECFSYWFEVLRPTHSLFSSNSSCVHIKTTAPKH